jgi:hypothetical protein
MNCSVGRGKENTMKKEELVALLEAVTVEELKSAIPMKEKFERLEKRRKSLEKELASVVKQLESLGMPKAKTSPGRAKKKGVGKARRRRVAQPSLSSLIVEILKEKKKPLKINDICDALLEEKNYQTRAKDFKAQVRVMMYRNDKGLFAKPKPGLFKLAAGVRPKKKTKKKGTKKATKKATKKVTKKTKKRASKKVRK